MHFVRVPGGCFPMGDVFGEGEHNETPIRETCVGEFYIGRTEVNQAEWARIMGSNPSAFPGEKYPVESVLLAEIEQFISRMNEAGNGVFRLPTEAEWEYACRAAGGKRRHGAGDGVAPLPPKLANTGGASGNVWEWVADVYAADAYRQTGRDNPVYLGNGPSRVVRGGSWMHPDSFARCSKRHMHCRPSVRYDAIGFRLVWQAPTGDGPTEGK